MTCSSNVVIFIIFYFLGSSSQISDEIKMEEGFKCLARNKKNKNRFYLSHCTFGDTCDDLYSKTTTCKSPSSDSAWKCLHTKCFCFYEYALQNQWCFMNKDKNWEIAKKGEFVPWGKNCENTSGCECFNPVFSSNRYKIDYGVFCQKQNVKKLLEKRDMNDPSNNIAGQKLNQNTIVPSTNEQKLMAKAEIKKPLPPTIVQIKGICTDEKGCLCEVSKEKNKYLQMIKNQACIKSAFSVYIGNPSKKEDHIWQCLTDECVCPQNSPCNKYSYCQFSISIFGDTIKCIPSNLKKI